MNDSKHIWQVKRDKGNKFEEEYYLELLKSHFDDVTTFEKHPDAMLNILFTQTYDEVLGPNFNKKRISKRKEKLIKEKLISRLRNKYGRWINLTNFKFKSPHNLVYSTNFNRVYKVKSSGILYGSPSQNICGNMFYTSHCLERFEERVPPLHYSPLIEDFQRIQKNEPTSADIVAGLVVASNMEYAIKPNFCYLNVRVGVLVIENFGDLFIAKTFLTPDMLNDLEWFQPLSRTKRDLNTFADFLKLESIKIKEPQFLRGEITEYLLQNFLEKEHYE